jgi:hypothetical protein
MLQHPTRCYPFRWIETCHGTYKVFEAIINTIPVLEWFSWRLLVESVPSHLEYLNPWVISKVIQEPTKSLFICRVGDLALDHDSKFINAIFQLFFSNREDDAPVNGADALDADNHQLQLGRTPCVSYDKSKRKDV